MPKRKIEETERAPVDAASDDFDPKNNRVYIVVKNAEVTDILENGYDAADKRVSCYVSLPQARSALQGELAAVLQVNGLTQDDIDSNYIKPQFLDAHRFRIVVRSPKKILWHDASGFAEGQEVAQYVEIFKQAGFEIQTCSSVDEADEFIGRNSAEKWLVFTSGTNGEDLVKRLHDKECVLAFFVFCGVQREEMHRQWAKDYAKVGAKNVESDGFIFLDRFRELVDRHVAMTVNIVVSSPTAYHNVIEVINRHYNGKAYQNGKTAHLYQMVITTGGSFELKLDPKHRRWFDVWKGMISGSLKLLAQQSQNGDFAVFHVNLITLKGGPVCDHEQKWLQDNKLLLEQEFDEIDHLEVKHCASIDDYLKLFEELGDPPQLPRIPPPPPPTSGGGKDSSNGKDTGDESGEESDGSSPVKD